ncbi:MAG: VCBS repeat-containing protein, partial [Verrucomicrobia bacterium]|nr:VCBS repeat-containing protein [Verrucomicrobiota bacterium]
MSTLRAALLLSLLGCAATRAADKSGVSPSAISLPKGPGSIEGLGESFQPSLNTGTARHGVALDLPPGTAGHAPSLSLSYEGGGGNGVLGIGWVFSVPWVQRQTDRGIPTYGDPVGVAREDIFINEQKEELVPATNGDYFCKNEGAFIRYRRAGNHWEGTLPNGTRLEFGLSSEGRIEDGTNGHVFAWLLERQTDSRGNTIVFAYRPFAGPQNTNQKYLASIHYGPGAPPWASFHFATLQYEDRPDWFEDCRPGFVVRTGKRLSRIVVGTQGPTLAGHQQGDFSADGVADNLNRIYELEYVPRSSTNTHGSLLGSIRLIGSDGTNSMPPATFGYVICSPPDELSAASREIGGVNEPALVMDNERVDLLDVNADGLPDVLRTGGVTHQAWLNRGETNELGMRSLLWTGPVTIESVSGDAWQFELSAANTHLADMDGDGLADLVHKAADESVFYFQNQGRQHWGERQPMAAGFAAPPAPFGMPDVRTADVDFDKRMDLIRGDGLFYQVWFNTGQNEYSERITIPADAGFDFSLPGVQIADLNGDRVPDTVRVRPATVQVTAGLGYGRFAGLTSVPIPDGPLDDTQADRAKLSDLNGDGLADLVLERAEPGVLWYWLNLGNYTLSGRKRITGMPSGVGQNPAIRWADLNGNGSTDLVYADSAASPRIRAVDLGELLNGGGTPNALVAISNGIGRVSLIGYRPSTAFALEDEAAGHPWPDPMPFPVAVVAEVTTLDSLGHEYVTRYRYHDGFYDGAGKQFRGFAHVEQVDGGESSAPTLLTRSHFDTGREHEALKGKLVRQSAELEDGRVFWDETTTWTAPPPVLLTGTNGTNVTFAHPVAKVRLVKELGQGAERRLESEFEYDRYGNLTREADYGIVEGEDRSAFDDERVATYQFALNLDHWIVRSPCRKEIRDEHGAVLSRTEDYYDDETFSGANPGQVEVGNPTLRREWVAAADPGAWVASRRTRYDAWGNPILMLDPLAAAPGGTLVSLEGHYREVLYDPHFQTHPVEEVTHLGHDQPPLRFEADYDTGFGRLTRARDYNGHDILYSYDAFGRLASVVRPGDTAAFPTTEYRYVQAQPFAPGRVVNYVETRSLDQPPASAGAKPDPYLLSREFTDGLGRQLMIKKEAAPDPLSGQARVAVSGATLYNARQQPARTLNPFFSQRAAGTLEQLLEFEDVAEPSWQGTFHQQGELVSLDLASAHQTTRQYDAILRTTQTTNPDGSHTRAEFEPLLARTFDENDT